MLLVCYSYVTRMYSYVLVSSCMFLVCTLMYLYATRMYSCGVLVRINHNSNGNGNIPISKQYGCARALQFMLCTFLCLSILCKTTTRNDKIQHFLEVVNYDELAVIYSVLK